jgi:cytoplasmic iron level regulating protein YaaA (DUF328/UPF0246 family)
VRILLPPSEAKHPGGRGKPLQARSSSGAFDQVRLETLSALQTLLDSDGAATALHLPASVAQLSLAHNAGVRSSPTMPALDRYAGILYDGLAVPGLTAGARRIANPSVLIFSGLFGVLRGADAVPIYRVPAKATLPGLGVAATFWREHLVALLPPLLDTEMIIDLRSGDYAAMWRPQPRDPVNERLIVVRVLSPKPDETLGVISYPSKFWKGKLAAGLLERAASGSEVRSIDDLIAAWLAVGGSDAVVRVAGSASCIDLITFTAAVV